MSDQELQLALAKMLPEKIELAAEYANEDGTITGRAFQWKYPAVFDLEKIGQQVTSREWPHVCWLVEQELRYKGDQFQWLEYSRQLWKVIWNREPTENDNACSGLAWNFMNASWQQRAEALCKVKGVEV
jgi:hypothetical protein